MEGSVDVPRGFLQHTLPRIIDRGALAGLIGMTLRVTRVDQIRLGLGVDGQAEMQSHQIMTIF